MKISRLIVSIFLCIIVGSISGFFTAGEIDAWYADLIKPALNPPNWVFGPVWTLLYIMMGIALYYYWNTASDVRKRNGYIAFFIQLTLNFFWSFFFFKMHAPAIALIEICILIVAIITTMVYFSKVSANAVLLLVPYLLWVCFATWLNYQIMALN